MPSGTGEMTDAEGMDETLVSEGHDRIDRFERNDREGRRGRAEPGDPSFGLGRGDGVGRYVILSHLGAGGMGVVYEAYDPELDRRVAIKLLRHRSLDAVEREGASQRLLREAQALARLSHPNVVAVHDVGTHDAQVFLAMEYVEGDTLGQWRKAELRSWRAVLDTFVAAGRGLAAAHEHGLIHRDFKPDNVMIDHRGRVRVMDFGLARLDGETSEIGAASRDAVETPSLERSSQPLTVTGALMGTPAYMSPEQHAGLPSDARSDQFSYCVSLYEALYGERPFRGETLASVGLAISEGRVAEPPRDTEVPTWLRRVLLRGLQADPAARWPDMPALIEALTDDPSARRRRAWQWSAGLGAVVLAVGAIVGARLVGPVETGPEARCLAGVERLDGVWNEQRRATVEQALVATETSFAKDTAVKVTTRIDDYASAWRSSYEDACRATWVRGEQSEALLDARMSCLSRRREALSYLVDLLEGADRSLAVEAVEAAASLPDLEACGDLDALRERVAPPTDPAVARTAVQVRSLLLEARTLGAAGQLDTAVKTARRGLDLALPAGYAPLTAEAQLALGDLLIEAGEFSDARDALQAAYFLAVETGHDAVAARAGAQLVYVVGYKLAAHDRGEDWVAHAVAVSRRLGQRTEHEALTLHNAGVLHDAVGRHDAAREAYEAALEIRQARFGLRHPATASTINNLGNVYLSTGDYDRAAAQYRRALELRTSIFGPDHPELTGSLNNLALVLRRRGELVAATRALERAVAITERAYGEDHASLAQYLDNLATVRRAAGEHDEALALDQRALALRIEHWGPDHPDVGDPLAGLAATHAARGDLDAAREHYARALALYESGFSDEHPIVVSTRVALAGVDAELGAVAQARDRLEQTLRDGSAGGAEPVDLAEGRLLLARLLMDHDAADTRPRALELAQAAHAAFVAAGPGFEARAGEAAAWIAEHQ